MPPERLSHAYATFFSRAKQFKSGPHQLEGSSIIGPRLNDCLEDSKLQSMGGFIGFARCGRIPREDL
jgi:hypothetical protein